MSWRSTAILALALAAVAFVAYRDVVREDPHAGWDVVFEEPLPAPPAQTIERLLDFEAGEVRALVLEHGDRRIETRRTAYGWTGTSQPRAINDFIESLTSLAVILRIEREASHQELLDYGLLDPQGRVTLTLDGGGNVTVDLGSHNPSATGIYARVRGRPGVVLTGAVAVWEIEKVLSAVQDDRDG